MRLARTSFALEEVRQFLGQSPLNPLIQNYLVQYLLIAFYSEVEEHVKEIISERLAGIEDRKVASFIFKSNEAMLKRVKKAEINDVLQKFDCGDGDVISNLVGDVNLQPYFDAITNRHLVSHQDGASMTLDEFARALPCAEAILEAVETALAPDDIVEDPSREQGSTLERGTGSVTGGVGRAFFALVRWVFRI